MDGFGIALLVPLLSGFNSDSNVFLDLPGALNFLNIEMPSQFLLFLVLTLFLVKAIGKFFFGFFKSRVFKTLFINLKKSFLASIVDLKYTKFSDRNAGEIINMNTDHIHKTILSFNAFLLSISFVVMGLSYFVLSSIMSLRPTVTLMVLGAVFVLFFKTINQYVKAKSIENEKYHNYSAKLFSDLLGSFEYFKATFQFPKIQKRYLKGIHQIGNIQKQINQAESISESTKELFALLIVLSIFWIEIEIFNQSISKTILVVLLLYRGVSNFMNVQGYWQLVVNNLGFIKSLDSELRNMASASSERSNVYRKEKKSSKFVFQAKEIQFRYSNSKANVLQQINFTIERNKITAITGKSGEGKSTLLKILLGLLHPQKGELYFFGENANQKRPKIGYIAQNAKLFDDTIKNNLTLWEDGFSNEQIEKALKKSSLWDFVSALENKMQTIVGDNGVRLSGGQKQKILIARELLKEPDILILDEATSSIDTTSEQNILNQIVLDKIKLTVILISHRESSIKFADNIYVLKNGRMTGPKTFEEAKYDQYSPFLSKTKQTI